MVWRRRFLHVVWKPWLQPLSWRSIVTLPLFLGGSQHLKLALVIISFLILYSSIYSHFHSIWLTTIFCFIMWHIFLQKNQRKFFISTIQCGQVTVILYMQLFLLHVLLPCNFGVCAFFSFWCLITEIANVFTIKDNHILIFLHDFLVYCKIKFDTIEPSWRRMNLGVGVTKVILCLWK